ncbi:flagellar biosynthetic protein FliO [Chitinivibrio alkaliphilus]|uniref:Flagellar biosynthetic protein FliO n=1 Tax=Chitinivibrio alkaliphilus ACht1 TaxID=1313304 RepID=U7D8R5_9BACT|nr:flagellar biosynthetic protein FliO [Chitinivibrio alkaliphilus]ERP39325.1 flagellar biosynthetic protein FliO [Chitinivibrio alkaliphilus ACht1]
MKRLLPLALLCMFSGSLLASFDMDKLQQPPRSVSQDSAPVDATSTVSDTPEEIPMPILMGRILFSLSLITILIVLLVWGLKKSQLFQKRGNEQTPSFEILEQIKTGSQGQSVLLLRFEQEVFLLGQTEGSMHVLQHKSGDTAKEIIADKRGSDTVGQFQTSLNRFVDSLRSNTPNEG